jgi:two-component system phosphate regulon sensor histidine kinase PhoR
VETLLEDGLDDTENSVRFLSIVRKNADRMEELIDDLTDLSQIETGAVVLELRDLDAREVAREVVAHLEAKRNASGVEVRVEIPDRFALRADRRRLEQILVNLVDNAIKFNRPGGWVRIEAATEGGRPVLAVADNGPGIPAGSHDKIFHRFYREDKARSREIGGTGLGLSIVKHLMLLHGGSVRVESELGKGARFVLEFPAPPGDPVRGSSHRTS